MRWYSKKYIESLIFQDWNLLLKQLINENIPSFNIFYTTNKSCIV